jgi:hypothetical protein
MKFKIFIILIAGMLAIFTACEKETPVSPMDHQSETEELPSSETEGLTRWAPFSGSVRVMTRNIYVGTDLDSVYKVSDPAMVPLAAAWAFQLLLSTDFNERAQALADEIVLGRPHLIGLQEISLFRIQSPGDMIVGGTVPAETVFQDFLAILMNALQQRGLNYRVAGIVENFDIEVPMITSPAPTFDDIRLTDYDVVLARHDVQINNVVEQNYQAALPIPGFGIDLPRGYIALDARVDSKTYRFVNTHLESISEQVRFAQAQELVAILSNETKPIILVGDLNTLAPDGNAYQYIINQGYVDSWDRNRICLNPDGYTAIHDPDLRNTTVKLDQRIDLILVKSHKYLGNRQIIGPVWSFVVGDELKDRTPSGLWPSDHAGVIARLRIPVDWKPWQN